MNERIKELSLQASDSIPDDVSAEHAMYLFQKKFAELIVQECNKIMAKQYQGPIPQDVRHMMLVLQEHFGVEDAPVDDVTRILQTVRTRGQ
jgi:hypothetical protein